MKDTEALYQSVILERSRQPRFRHKIAGASAAAKCINPLCGDEVAVELRFDRDDRVAEVGFTGEGCAILLASSDLMAETVAGLDAARLPGLAASFEAMLAGGPETEDPALACFAPLRDYPARRRCATLAWEALAQAANSASRETWRE